MPNVYRCRNIYWSPDGTCTISENQMWLPGCYATPQAAMLAFDVQDFTPLQEMALNVPITLEQVEAHIRQEQNIAGPIEVSATWK